MKCTIRSLCLSTFLSASLLACSADEEGEPDDSATPDAGASTPGDGGSGVVGDAGTSSGSDAASPLDAGGARDAGATRDASSPSDAGTAMDAGDTGAAASDSGSGGDASALPKFSFFVTSLNAMRTLSKSPNGFGGNLSYGETGEGAGLRGADKICADAAEMGMPGAKAKEWRAFLSTTTVHAKDRVGQGPWYDRTGRLIAQNLTALMKERPEGAEAVIRDDLPNENGAPNRAASAEGSANDNHDMVTATNASGEYDGTGSCEDWTSTNTPAGGGQRGPRVGHSWPAQSGRNWMAAHRAPGCSPSVSLVQTGGGSGTGIGNGGGYGGIYCFALTP